MSFLKGDHIYIKKSGYTHHGIYIGRNSVIHYAGYAEIFKSIFGLSDNSVQKIPLSLFEKESPAILYKGKSEKFSRDEVVERAHSRLGEDLYSLFSNNCEHFCNWCTDDEHHSKQWDFIGLGKWKKDGLNLMSIEEKIEYEKEILWKISNIGWDSVSEKVASARLFFILNFY